MKHAFQKASLRRVEKSKGKETKKICTKICTNICPTRAKFFAKQRMGLPLMLKGKLEVLVRSIVLKPMTRVTKTKRC